MLVPLSVRFVNTKSGEIIFSKVISEFQTLSEGDVKKLHKLLDSYLRGVDKLFPDTLAFEISSHNKPKEQNIF